jgi:hypothetical protein
VACSSVKRSESSLAMKEAIGEDVEDVEGIWLGV